jgi:signal transduction histidine kinase
MFNYRQIGRALIEELTQLVIAGNSVALFAPRYVGKRHVMDRVRDEVRSAGRSHIVELRLLHEKPALTGRELAEQLGHALKESGIGARISAADPFEAIEAVAEQVGTPIFLFVANVDSMAHGLTLQMLQRLRKLIQNNRLVVMLSGETDFLGLVYGPDSDFDCSENYFLQGYEEEEFGVFLDQYARTLNIELDSREEILRHFWKRTGGNSYLVRPLIIEVVENKARRGAVINAGKVSLEDFKPMPRAKAIPGAYSTQLCRHATRMMAWVPEQWPVLEKLIKKKWVRVEDPKPTQLEWAGIAVRDGDQLKFASEMMENYAKLHYTDMRFGDLYARNGRWNEAFERYARCSPEEKRRPLSVDDLSEAEKTINAFRTALFSELAKSKPDEVVDNVKALFVQGCQHLLGFGEVTFWRYVNGWQPRPFSHKSLDPLPDAPEELKTSLSEILPPPEKAENNMFIIPAPWNSFAVAAKLKSLFSDYSGAIVVSDLERKIPLLRERGRLLEMMLRQFIEAHTHAIDVAKAHRRLETRNRQMETLDSVFKAMGKQVTDVDGVLKRASRGLLELKYSRVLFCLVDPKRERIQGVFDYSNDWPRVNVAKATDYALSEIDKDIQPYVIATRRPFVSSDASRERLTNKIVVEQAGMTALAIVPILNHAGEAIGTIHVERMDKLRPSNEEVEDLMIFGGLLATAIEQAERVNLLQKTLDKIPEPVAIIGARKNFWYANKAASDMLEIINGWQDRSDGGMSLSDIPPQFREVAEQSLRVPDGHRISRHIGEKGEQQGLIGTALSERLTDFRGGTVGAFLYIQELTNFYRVFPAFLTIASKRDTEQAVGATLDAAKLLGYQQGRLYVIDQATGDLVSKSSYGMTDQEKVLTFDQGGIRIRRNPAYFQSWISIEEKQPVVFRYEPSGIEGGCGRTAQGLEYRVTTEHYHRNLLSKWSGDFWVDVPLLTRDRPLGKLILPCDKYLKPESFELLKALFDNHLLEDFTQHEREQLEMRAMAAEKVMADVAHNIATRFGSFPGYLHAYRRYERQLPGLKGLNDDFAHALQQALTTVKRAKERLAPVVKLKYEKIELADYLDRVFKSLLPENDWVITSDIGPIEMEIDTHLIEVALSELIENSKAAQENPERLSVRVCILPASDAPGRAQIIYRDNGPGVAEEIRSRIFEDFFSHRPNSGRGSTGLGMGFTRRVIKAHGGNIELGAPERGAEFIITLPQHSSLDYTTPHSAMYE